MPALSLLGGNRGILVSVNLGVDSTRRGVLLFQHQAVPADQPAVFLLDCGSSHSYVDEDLVRPLGLTSLANQAVRTLNGTAHLPTYRVQLTLFGTNPGQGWQVDRVRISASSANPYQGEPYRGLLGRDVLDRAILLYDGPSGHATLLY